MNERALLIAHDGDTLPAILHAPAAPRDLGVLIVVGGPQYRVGSHRQFVLLARALCAAGYPVLRFDYAGMGDATGDARSFEQAGPDIRAAIDRFCDEAGLSRVVLWGLCDAASASLFHAHGDARVAGLALANPWVRTAASEANAYLKHYYRQRLFSPAFWGKLLTGGFDWRASLASLRGFWRQRRGARPEAITPHTLSGSLPERMAQAWRAFPGPILLLLSGDDLTAREFLDVAGAPGPWSGLLSRPQVSRYDLPEANHTFSCQAWRDQVAACTIAWLARLTS